MLPRRHPDLERAPREDVLRWLEQAYLVRQAEKAQAEARRKWVLEQIADWFAERRRYDQD